MKKAKATLKKSNKIKTKSASKPIVGRMKSLAKGLVKAMSPKASAVPAKKLEAAKKSAVVSAKSSPTKDSGKHGKLPKEVAVEIKKSAPAPVLTKGKVPPTKPSAAAPVAAAILTKGKGKALPKAKGSKLTGAALAEHLEKMCRETGCENQSSTKGYCRLDYIKNWKKIKRKEMILKEGKLNQYIEELVNKYPEKYIDVIRQDLVTEVNFNKVIHDLELDESIDEKEAEDFGSDDEF
jgi:hypothetical protein